MGEERGEVCLGVVTGGVAGTFANWGVVDCAEADDVGPRVFWVSVLVAGGVADTFVDVGIADGTGDIVLVAFVVSVALGTFVFCIFFSTDCLGPEDIVFFVFVGSDVVCVGSGDEAFAVGGWGEVGFIADVVGVDFAMGGVDFVVGGVDFTAGGGGEVVFITGGWGEVDFIVGGGEEVAFVVGVDFTADGGGEAVFIT
jgi:hypothetical protein